MHTVFCGSREDIHVHVQSEGEEAGGVVADHSKGQDTHQSTIAIQTEVDEDAITVSWQVPRHNDVGGAHILHRHSIKSIRCWGKEGEEDDITYRHCTQSHHTYMYMYHRLSMHVYTVSDTHIHTHAHTHMHTHICTHTCTHPHMPNMPASPVVILTYTM